MSITVTCPGCNGKLTAKDEHAGQIKKCPKCKSDVEVPAPVDWSAGALVSHELEEQTGAVNFVTFSPDGKWIANASDDGTARIRDVATGKEFQKFNFAERIFSWDENDEIAFSPDGKLIAIASGNEIAQIWDVATGNVIHKLIHTDELNSVAYTQNQKEEQDKGGIWGLKTGLRVNSVVFSPDGKLVATACSNYNAIIWDAATGKVVQKLEGHIYPVKSVTFSPDGYSIATAAFDWTARIWLVATGTEIRKFKVNTHHCVNSVAFSPDGKLIATAGLDETVRIWDTQKEKEVHILSGHTDYEVNCVAFSPDGKWLVSAGRDKTARIWDVASGKEAHKLEGHSEEVKSIAFSPDGKWIATASSEKTTRIWKPVNVQSVFVPVKKENTIEVYAGYLSKFPCVSNRNIALAGMYELVKQENNVVCYAWFLTNFSDAPQAADARLRMNAEAFKIAKQFNTVEALNDFIIAYPLAKEVGEAREIAYQLEKERYTLVSDDDKEKKARLLLNKLLRIWLDSDNVQPSDLRLGYALVVKRMTDLLETEFSDQAATTEILFHEVHVKRHKEILQSLGTITKLLSRLEDAIHQNTRQTAALMRQQVSVMTHYFGIVEDALHGISSATQSVAGRIDRVEGALHGISSATHSVARRIDHQVQSQEYLNWHVEQVASLERRRFDYEQRMIGYEM